MSTAWTAFRALVAADLKIARHDRRALLMRFIVPLAIAGLMGLAFGGGGKAAPGRIPVAVVNQDHSKISQAVVAGLAGDATLEVTQLDAASAREQVRKGRIRVAVILPPGFGEAAGRAFLASGTRPEVPVLYDPSQAFVVAMVKGMLMQHVFTAVTQQLFSGPEGPRLIDDALAGLESSPEMPAETRSDLRELLARASSLNRRSQESSGGLSGPARGGLSAPFSVAEEAVVAGGVPYNGYAHATAGMGVQFVLMMGIEAGVALLEQRRRGWWLRMRAAPVSRRTVLASRITSAAISALLMLGVLYAGAALLFGVRVEGSLAGFVGVIVAFSLTTAAFGLLIAALGRTPDATRGLAIFATLVMVLLGGGWVPSFLFPPWLQQFGKALPTYWAIEGLEGTTWRGLGMDVAGPSIAVLVAFAVLFSTVAVWRFRWDAERA
jgi:ABC-2 type transport system permease protein